jgi:uncharacterized membrane protein YvbJ
MKSCSACTHEYDEDFKFCPECGQPFGGAEAADLKRKMDQHLLDMKQSASREAALTRRALSGQGFGDSNIGPVYGNGGWG